MKTDLTDITVILDRSGSMRNLWEEAVNGYYSFAKEQAKAPGECVFSLVAFDHEYKTVFSAIPADRVAHHGLPDLLPRGTTALLDAIGRTINDVGERLRATPEEGRPGTVLINVITDGQENSSREFTAEMLRDMIERQRSVYKWQFAFLGTNMDAVLESGKVGISRGATMSFANNPEALRDAYAVVSASTVSYRGAGGASDGGGDFSLQKPDNGGLALDPAIVRRTRKKGKAHASVGEGA